MEPLRRSRLAFHGKYGLRSDEPDADAAVARQAVDRQAGRQRPEIMRTCRAFSRRGTRHCALCSHACSSPPILRGHGGDTVAKADSEEVRSQLATRAPKALRQALRLECVRSDTTVQEFVTAALREKFAREAGRRRRRA